MGNKIFIICNFYSIQVWSAIKLHINYISKEFSLQPVQIFLHNQYIHVVVEMAKLTSRESENIP